MKKDNTTLTQKVALRREAMATIADPVILETHGGFGKIYEACYSRITRGAVFEKDEEKAESLASQRPAWSVYNSSCEAAIEAGACSHLPFNLLDVDPYGSPFGAIGAFLRSSRKRVDELHLVVNDGMRNKVKMGGGWMCHDLRDIVADYGNNLYKQYLQVAKEKIRRLAKTAGYELFRWKGYHCGFAHDMTHYWAVLKRPT